MLPVVLWELLLPQWLASQVLTSCTIMEDVAIDNP